MVRYNRDTIVAIFLLALTGIFFWATFEIREPDYGVLTPSAWPRIIIAALGILSFIYLVQSNMEAKYSGTAETVDAQPAPGTLMDRLLYWRNPIACFALFLLFLITLPILGMLIGGTIFVFLLLSVLGGWSARQVILHATIAILSIGVMWSIFTFGLRVILPPGMIFDVLR